MKRKREAEQGHDDDWIKMCTEIAEEYVDEAVESPQKRQKSEHKKAKHAREKAEKQARRKAAEEGRKLSRSEKAAAKATTVDSSAALKASASSKVDKNEKKTQKVKVVSLEGASGPAPSWMGSTMDAEDEDATTLLTDNQVVKWFDQDETAGDKDDRTVYVGGLPVDQGNEVGMHSIFGECGKIRDTRIIRDKSTGKPKGTLFLEFTHKASVALALGLSGKLIEEKLEGGKVIKHEIRVDRTATRGGMGGSHLVDIRARRLAKKEKAAVSDKKEKSKGKGGGKGKGKGGGKGGRGKGGK